MSSPIAVHLTLPADFPALALERAIAELAIDTGCRVRRDGLNYTLRREYFPRMARVPQEAAHGIRQE
jgi:hypothetical protein